MNGRNRCIISGVGDRRKVRGVRFSVELYFIGHMFISRTYPSKFELDSNYEEERKQELHVYNVTPVVSTGQSLSRCSDVYFRIHESVLPANPCLCSE